VSKRFGFVALIGVLVLTVVGVDLYLKEKINRNQFVGIIMVTAGVVFLGL